MIFIMALAIMISCVLLVFERRIQEGIVASHLFAFSSMVAVCAVHNPENYYAFIWSIVLLLLGFVAWYVKTIIGGFYGRKRGHRHS